MSELPEVKIPLLERQHSDNPLDLLRVPSNHNEQRRRSFHRLPSPTDNSIRGRRTSDASEPTGLLLDRRNPPDAEHLQIVRRNRRRARSGTCEDSRSVNNSLDGRPISTALVKDVPIVPGIPIAPAPTGFSLPATFCLLICIIGAVVQMIFLYQT